MKLYYFHSANEVPENFPKDTAVVIDVLRATTTIAWALKNGAESVKTFADVEKLKLESLTWPKEKRVLIGERGGKKLDGFDLGNSPLGVTSEFVSGKRIFMSTTNGTKALKKVDRFSNLFTLCLPNRKAISRMLLNVCPNYVCLLGSGWEGSYSLEDSLAAGSLASLLLDIKSINVNIGNDELQASIALWQFWKDDIEGCLRIASHGQRLAEIANHDDDFSCCAELDTLDVVPLQKEQGVLRAFQID